MGVQKLLNAIFAGGGGGGGGILYLQNIPLMQVVYDLHVDTLFILHGLSFLYWTVALSRVVPDYENKF